MSSLCKHKHGAADSASCVYCVLCVTAAVRGWPPSHHEYNSCLSPLHPKCSGFVSLQPENEEKSIVYDNIGSNVCMGDHKVTTPSLTLCDCVALLWIKCESTQLHLTGGVNYLCYLLLYVKLMMSLEIRIWCSFTVLFFFFFSLSFLLIRV